MSTCCSTYGAVASAHFNEKIARRELTSYRKKGPGSTTRLLRDLLLESGAVRGTALDVGSGVGALTFELLEHGVERAIAVDASPANLAAATEEAIRRGRERRRSAGAWRFPRPRAQHSDGHGGDTRPRRVLLSVDQPLLEESLRHAERYFAYSYPRDVWYVRAAIAFENAIRRIRANPFRAFVHPVERMTQVIEGAGLRLVSRRQNWQWSAEVYVR